MNGSPAQQPQPCSEPRDTTHPYAICPACRWYRFDHKDAKGAKPVDDKDKS